MELVIPIEKIQKNMNDTYAQFKKKKEKSVNELEKSQLMSSCKSSLNDLKRKGGHPTLDKYPRFAWKLLGGHCGYCRCYTCRDFHGDNTENYITTNMSAVKCLDRCAELAEQDITSGKEMITRCAAVEYIAEEKQCKIFKQVETDDPAKMKMVDASEPALLDTMCIKLKLKGEKWHTGQNGIAPKSHKSDRKASRMAARATQSTVV
jgi:hypothetical protein